MKSHVSALSVGMSCMLLMASCGTDKKVCTPGEQTDCSCANGFGTQRCADDGMRYEECVCFVCTPGEQNDCLCPDLSQRGVQTCADDGLSLGACKPCCGAGTTYCGGSCQSCQPYQTPYCDYPQSNALYCCDLDYPNFCSSTTYPECSGCFTGGSIDCRSVKRCGDECWGCAGIGYRFDCVTQTCSYCGASCPP